MAYQSPFKDKQQNTVQSSGGYVSPFGTKFTPPHQKPNLSAGISDEELQKYQNPYSVSNLWGGLKRVFTNPVESFKNTKNFEPLTPPLIQSKDKVTADLWNVPVATAVDTVNRFGEALKSFQTKTPLSEKIGKSGSAILGAANVTFTPLSTAFKALEDQQFSPNPVNLVSKYGATGVNKLFSKIGEYGGKFSTFVLDKTPGLSQKDKDNLKPFVNELGGLLGQVAIGGKVIEKTIPLFSSHLSDVIKENKELTPENVRQVVDDAAQRTLNDITEITDKHPALPKFEEPKLLPERTPQVGAIQGNNFTMKENATPAEIKLSSAQTKYQTQLDKYNSNPTPAKLKTVLKSKAELEKLKTQEPVEQPAQPIKQIVTQEVPKVETGNQSNYQSNNYESPFKPKASQRIEQVANEFGLDKVELDKIPEVERYHYIEKANELVDIIGRNIETARDILRGNKPLPEGYNAGTYLGAVLKYARDTKDFNLFNEMRTSPLLSETSSTAQGLASLKLLNENNPAKILADAAKENLSKISKYKKKGILDEAVKADRKTNLSKDDLLIEKFLDSIKC